jgi:mRNA interferase RelE/StbE
LTNEKPKTALYGIAYTESDHKYLAGNVPSKIRGQLKRRIEALTLDPRPAGSKKLVGVSDGDHDVYRIRSGDYRIVYSVRGNPHQIIVFRIGNRKDIYR